ncbi:OmpA family protein [Aureisphaera galaxeae]|uniref:OmpA family protein n=1 Tax=Aureisphaera galaxeae TaxID=1538023 RepID=UPI002350C9FC|nr:OmpA family protein [Aureisphaera galaxeae]MDC8004508.1 OmpA family protein [Aureisphaera galaxeae]
MSLLVISVTSISFAQKNRIEKANKEFDKYSYIDAREIYLKVVEDGYASAQVFQKLGDTYYFNSEYGQAAEWYQRSINEFTSETDAIYYYRAAQALKSLGKYDESDKLMAAYEKVGGDNIIIRNFNEDPNYLKSIAFQAKGYEVEKVSINTDSSDFGPSFYLDKLVFAKSAKANKGEKVFEWNQLPFLDLYVADMDAEGRLSNVTPLDGEINTKYHESSSVFTKDGRTVYFTRNNFTDGKKGRDKNKTIRLKLYKAIKSGDNYWTNIEELPFNSDDYSVAHPALSVDEKRLYFASDRPGSLGMSDLWYVDINEDGTYGDPINLGPTVNTEARESFPFISENSNLYFSSDGRSGLGGLDIYVTQLDNGGTSGKVTNLGEPANSNQDDFGFIINESARLGYLSSNRDGDRGSLSDDIYRVQEKCEITIVGAITNKVTGDAVPGAIVTLLDSNNTALETVTAKENGSYEFKTLVECDTTYLIRANSDGCEYNEEIVETPNVTGKIEVPVKLECDPCPPDDLGCRLSLQPIYFDFDRYNIRPDAAIELAKILAAMREYPQLIIHIESHTDSRGNDAYNEALSEKRAQSTLNWLVDNGIDKNRLTAKGYGEYQLQNECSNGVECTEEAHQLNRRSMFLIQN